MLAEVTAICEYVDEKKKDTPSLIGDTPEERAKTRMWTRRIDLNIVEPALNGFRFSQGLKLFENRVRCIPEAADALKATAQDKLKWLDGLMGGNPFVGGNKLTMADIMLFTFVDFMGTVGQPISGGLQEPHRLVRPNEGPPQRGRLIWRPLRCVA